MKYLQAQTIFTCIFGLVNAHKHRYSQKCGKAAFQEMDAIVIFIKVRQVKTCMYLCKWNAFPHTVNSLLEARAYN